MAHKHLRLLLGQSFEQYTFNAATIISGGSRGGSMGSMEPLF